MFFDRLFHDLFVQYPQIYTIVHKTVFFSVTHNVIQFQELLSGRQLIFLVHKTMAKPNYIIRNSQKGCRVNSRTLKWL